VKAAGGASQNARLREQYERNPMLLATLRENNRAAVLA